MRYKAVKEHPSFVRDMRTGVLVNTSKSEYQEFIDRQKRKLAKEKNFESRLNTLEEKMDRILKALEK